jgi:hypothetical protein
VEEDTGRGEAVKTMNKPIHEAAFDINELDHGIRCTVAWLRARGFDTTDSGDGKAKFAQGFGAAMSKAKCVGCDRTIEPDAMRGVVVVRIDMYDSPEQHTGKVCSFDCVGVALRSLADAWDKAAPKTDATRGCALTPDWPGELVADTSGAVCTLDGKALLRGDPDAAKAIVEGFNAWARRQRLDANDSGLVCLCPATSEYDPPCPKHGVLGIGVMGG